MLCWPPQHYSGFPRVGEYANCRCRYWPTTVLKWESPGSLCANAAQQHLGGDLNRAFGLHNDQLVHKPTSSRERLR